MDRREFLGSATAIGLAGLSGRTALGFQGAAAPPDWRKVRPATLERIAIMTLNFQSILKVPDTQPGPNRTLELFDVGEMLADTYGVHKVEFQHYHLASTEPSYLKELRSRLERSKSRATQINLEFSGLNISAPQQRDRVLAIDLTKMWVDHAVAIGAARVMINQGQPTDENKANGIAALKVMADYGRSKKIIVSVETRGGGGGRAAQAGAAAPGTPAQPSAARAGAPAAAGPPAPPPTPPLSAAAVWDLLAELIKGAGAYSNVDFGGANAPDQAELHRCLRMMHPMSAGTLHTRVNARWDLATVLGFLERDLGYRGLYTLEAGNGHEGTRPIYDVVVATVGAPA